ncbi:MAG: heparinase II/III family protein [Clostridia bacterium]|nr:heparinase II/III family protein [Clostridia bacterium]
MGRKIFSEANYDVKSLILPIEEFKLFCDREQGFSLRPEFKDQAIEKAEKLMDKKYGVLTACEYLLRFRIGDRAHYEGIYFERRTDLMTLLVAEAYEKAGRFTDKIMDLVWMIMEESTWVIPAHLNPNPADMTHQLPYAYDGKRDYIDLFAGATGAALAFAWYICREDFDKISPVINKRILEQLHDRIIVPFTEHIDTLAWMGNGPYHWINNWCPWIISNVLTVCAITTADLALRQKVVEIAFEGLDKFTNIYAEDAACDEGPSYWGAACGALYSACLVLYDMSGGKINTFRDPLMIKMGEFFPKAYICDGRFLNFSDAASRLGVNNAWGYDWGKLSGSRLMQEFWETFYAGRGKIPAAEHFMPYRAFRVMGMEEIPERSNFKASLKEYFPSLDLSICRDSEEPQNGLYLSLKGHHNSASHNHLDVGNFVIFCDGDPIFIDAGVGTYTARTFNQERYTIWSMRSEYHNVPTINCIDQRPGRVYAAKNAQFDESTGKLTLDLTDAYHADAAVESYIRSAVIEDGKAIVCDELTSKKDGKVTFNLLCNAAPEIVGAGCFRIHGKLVNYDPSLTLEVDSPDCTWVEAQKIPGSWNCDKLYRIRLTAPLEAGKKQIYKLEIYR